ncbi:MAG: PKD domain-containing protein [Methanobacterium formicicum]
MNKKIIFITLSCLMVLILCGSASATDPDNTTNITQNNHVYINVSNDNGVKYNVDYDYYLNDPTYSQGGSNGTYYIKAEGGGLNQLHICDSNSTSAMYGQITVTNTTSGTQSGVFYITTTGGRGTNDDIILLLSVKGPISDNFNLTIVSSGYTWIISVFGATQPPLPTNPQYVVGAVNETFTKDDFKYGPQTTRPAPSGWQPLYSGQNTSDYSTAEYLMFIDLYVGNLKSGLAQAPIDNGAVKVEYTLNNMYTTASFNAYAWTGASFQGTGINWCNPIINNANPCVVTVNYAPETPVANFTADKTSGSDSLTVKFTDSSSNYPTSWMWDFGDGTTSTEQNPTHTYSAPGNYTVKLTATNLAGSNTMAKTDFITVLKSEVYVQITPSIANPTVGDKVTYTFKLGNKGLGDASNVVFTYVLPEGVEYAGANVDQGTVNYDPTTRTLTWNVGNVTAGTDPYLWLNLNILNPGTFNIQPTVTVAGNNIGLNNIGTLQVNAAKATTPTTNTVNAATTTSIQTGTVPMQTTGAPLVGLILGILCIGSGITLSRKK